MTLSTTISSINKTFDRICEIMDDILATMRRYVPGVSSSSLCFSESSNRSDNHPIQQQCEIEIEQPNPSDQVNVHLYDCVPESTIYALSTIEEQQHQSCDQVSLNSTEVNYNCVVATSIQVEVPDSFASRAQNVERWVDSTIPRTPSLPSIFPSPFNRTSTPLPINEYASVPSRADQILTIEYTWTILKHIILIVLLLFGLIGGIYAIVNWSSNASDQFPPASSTSPSFVSFPTISLTTSTPSSIETSTISDVLVPVRIETTTTTTSDALIPVRTIEFN